MGFEVLFEGVHSTAHSTHVVSAKLILDWSKWTYTEAVQYLTSVNAANNGPWTTESTNIN